MYRRLAAILFPITAIAFIAVGVWGYQENQEKNSILIKAENQYQRAFHDLNNHVDKMQGEMGKALAVNSSKQMGESMNNVWRLAYSAQEDIGQLPLTLMPFDKAEEFVANIGRFAHQMSTRNLEKQPLDSAERKRLQALYQHSEQIRNGLGSLQNQVLNKNLRWMDVESALSTENKKMDNTIVDGFKKVNKTVEQYREVDWGPTVNNLHVQMREKYHKLKGPKVSSAEIKKRTAKLLGLKSTRDIRVTLNKKGDYQTYSSYWHKGKHEVNADWTVVGGHLVWMMKERPYAKNRLSNQQASLKALQFARNHGYGKMRIISHDRSGHAISLQMVHQIDQVLVYPEAISIKIALDNGEVIGVQADEFVFNRQSSIPTKPAVSEQEARKKVSRHVKVDRSNLAYIYNEAGQGVLCYEFLGRMQGKQYRVFINAKTLDEEMIERIEKAV
ncbi:spore germination protein [Seinonella peptonophila]|uniref:Spore germination protein n=1 Tax=Seinonella peptonophila TaxID=112248 RepID=A0A1M4THC5_9BACL|nr:germination protein YpeB [Seinonella peptonophila]SHE43870.1 spore germination protein [Seinonella peptonophila]